MYKRGQDKIGASSVHPMCLYVLLREHSLACFPAVLTTEILFDFAVNGFGGESEFLVEHFERCAVAEVAESENSSGISGQSFEDHRQTGSEEEFLCVARDYALAIGFVLCTEQLFGRATHHTRRDSVG